MKIKLLSLLLLVMLLGGCLQTTPLSDRAMALCLGVDYDASQRQFVLTSQILDISEEEEKVISFSAPGQTLQSAMDELTQLAGRELFFGGTPVILLGGGVGPGQLEELTGFFDDVTPLRPKTQVMASGKPVKEQIEQVPENLGQLLRDAAEEGRRQGVMIPCPLFRLTAAVETGELVLIPTVELEQLDGRGTQIHSDSSTVLAAGQLRGQLRGSEVKAVALLSGQKSEKLALPIGNGVVMEVISRQPHIEVQQNGGELRFTIRLAAGAKLRHAGRKTDYDEMERQAAQKLEELIHSVLQSQLREQGSDVFGLGRYVRKYQNRFYTLHETEMEEKLQDAETEVLVDVRMMGK